MKYCCHCSSTSVFHRNRYLKSHLYVKHCAELKKGYKIKYKGSVYTTQKKANRKAGNRSKYFTHHFIQSITE